MNSIFQKENKIYRKFQNEIVELGRGSCSCCGDRYPIKDTNMCPECIIFSEECFYNSRFPIIEKGLSLEKAKIFRNWSFQKKKLMVNNCIKKGVLSW